MPQLGLQLAITLITGCITMFTQFVCARILIFWLQIIILLVEICTRISVTESSYATNVLHSTDDSKFLFGNSTLRKKLAINGNQQISQE